MQAQSNVHHRRLHHVCALNGLQHHMKKWHYKGEYDTSQVAMADLDTTATRDNEDKSKNSATKYDEGTGDGEVDDMQDDVMRMVKAQAARMIMS